MRAENCLIASGFGDTRSFIKLGTLSGPHAEVAEDAAKQYRVREG